MHPGTGFFLENSMFFFLGGGVGLVALKVQVSGVGGLFF